MKPISPTINGSIPVLGTVHIIQPRLMAGLFLKLLTPAKTPVYLTLLNSFILIRSLSVGYKGPILPTVKPLKIVLNKIKSLCLSVGALSHGHIGTLQSITFATFMTQEQIKELRGRVKHLHRFLRIDERTAKVESDRQLTLSPGFWDDNVRATGILKEIKVNKFWVDLYDKINTSVEDFVVLFDFWKENEATEEEARAAYDTAVADVEDGEFRSTLNEPEDEMPAVMVINSGAGGTESQDWAEMLLRMYRMYGEKQGWKVSELDLQDGDGAGIKQATLEFEGAFSYGLLKAGKRSTPPGAHISV